MFGCSSIPDNRLDIKQFSMLPLKEQLNPFKSDGCSGWPEGTRKNSNLWLHCCFDHDIAYWLGGSRAAREKADLQFSSCVKKTNNLAATIMYIGVRNLGGPKMDTPYKWGYGWSYERGYLTLNRREANFAKNFLPKKNQNMRDYLIMERIDRPKKIEDLIKVKSKFIIEEYDPEGLANSD